MLEEKFLSEMTRILGNEIPYRICILVSGGSDSMALLMLMHKFSKIKNVEIYCITIDHKLRKESRGEALYVKSVCEKLEIYHEILNWDHELLEYSIQEKARNARYSLASDFCKKHSIEVGVTGHIFSDQIEQLLISISQGAGIYSFLINEKSIINEVNYIRPLLSFTKEELQNYLKHINIEWVEDKSNKDIKYLRNNFRKFVNELLAVSDKSRIFTSIQNIKRAAESLDKVSDHFIKNYVLISDLGYAKLSNEKLVSLDQEIILSVIRKLLLIVGNRSSEIRLESIINVIDSIKNSLPKTLAGARIIPLEGNIYFIREIGRKKINNQIKNGLWDNRFQISNLQNYKISLLSEKDYGEYNRFFMDFDEAMPKILKKNIIQTLPCVFFLEKLIGIPHIYNYAHISENLGIEIKFLK